MNAAPTRSCSIAPVSYDFDLVVIGSGPAGEKGAAQAAYFGKKVAVIEKEPKPGGAAVHTGTLPSKTLRETALYLSGHKTGELYGISVSSNALATQQIFQPAPEGRGGGGSQWWPEDLGSPSSSGSQNDIRYAFFPQARRLAVQRDGQVSLFDTEDHSIGGVSQQQGGGSSLTFTSQYGTVSTLSLPLISGPGFQSQAANNFAAPPAHPSFASASPQPQSSSASGQGHAEILALLEKLGQLRDAGVLTPEEFSAKKTDLLNRL